MNVTVENRPTGWVCPKCGRVWSPDTNQCMPCNSKLADVMRERAASQSSQRLDAG